MPTPAVDQVQLPTYCPASSILPDDLKTALDSAAVCVVVAAGGRKVFDPDGILLKRPLTETSLFQRLPPRLDLPSLCDWLHANVPGMADLAAACRNMEGDRELSLFLGVSGQPYSFTCWHEAALSCRPAHGIPTDTLRSIFANCRAEAEVAHQLRMAASACAPSRPPEPTAFYCLWVDDSIQWKGKAEARPQLRKMLRLLLNNQKWPLAFGDVEDAVWGEDTTTKRIKDTVSILNILLEQVDFPWVYRTRNAHVQREGRKPRKSS